MEQIKEYEYVDLGLPSGLKWAKCNVGAEKETDYGDYFMWGSTEPNTKTICTWATCPFNNCNTDYNNEYFNTIKNVVCPNGVLAKEYDAAYQATEGKAHMPTAEQFKELLDNTDNEWIEDFNGSGVNGRKFTSRTDTSKYIFIPAAGSRYSSSFFDQKHYGSVWSSSIVVSQPNCSSHLDFIYDDYRIGEYYHCDGFSVRSVSDN